MSSAQEALPPRPPPPLPSAAADEAASGGGGVFGDKEVSVGDEATAAMMEDLAPYFSALVDSLHRNNDANNNNNNNSSATNNDTSSSNSAAQSRSLMVSLLWNGVELIAAAAAGGPRGIGNNCINIGDGSIASGHHEQQGAAAAGSRGTFFIVDHDHVVSGASFSAMTFPPKFAAVYLFAVAQNIVALEEVVLQQMMGLGRAGGGGGAVMDVLEGGISVKQVAEIVSAASIAAIFCKSRDIIAQSGILPALAHLIESTGTRGGGGGIGGNDTLRALTPFDPEFIQICLLAGQYRYAQSFLQSHPVRNMTFDFLPPHILRLSPTMYLRYQYYSGLVHIGCDDWNSSLDSFYLCLTIPCQTVSAISIAARKKSLLVECILLEAYELDDKHYHSSSSLSGSGSGRKPLGRSAVESRVLDVPGAASPVVARYMARSWNRVGSGGDECFDDSLAPPGGSETSEQPSTRDRSGLSRRRLRGASSNISSDGGDDGGGAATGGGRKAKSHSQLGRYHELLSTYISGNANHYATMLTEMTGLLRADGNWGLAKRLEGRLVYRAVRQKASVYSVTSMSDLEETLQKVCSNLGSTGGEIGTRRIEDLLMGMTACDWEDPLVADPFVAKMDHSSNMVSLQDEDCRHHEAANAVLEEDLSNRLALCVALAERVRTLDIGLTTAPRYQQHAMKQKILRKGDVQPSQQGQGVADLPGAMDLSADW